MSRSLALAFALSFAFTFAFAEEQPVTEKKKPARNFLPIGALATVSSNGADGVQGGLGVEISYVHYFGFGDVFGDFGLGPVAQVQMVNADRVRGSLGIEGNILFLGVSVAAALEQGESTRYGTTAFLDITPYLTGGYVSLGFRIGVPLGVTGGAARPLELGGAFTIKWPTALDGPLPKVRRAL
jgi:hypothetical protein